MATIKLKKLTANSSDPRAPQRGPLRGAAPKARPTLAQAQTQRAEREAQYQEQLRQRFGDRPPEGFARRAEPSRQTVDPRQRREPLPPATVSRSAPFDPRARPAPQRQAQPHSQPPSRQPRERNTAFGERPAQPAAFPTFEQHRPPAQAPKAPQPPRGRARHRIDDDDDFEAQPAAHAPGSMRLSKRMSELGIASRREADEWIAKGWVRVDDQIVASLGSRVMPGQRVTVDAKAKFQQAQRVTVLINKPVGYVSGQAEDGYEPAFVLVQPDNLWSEDHSGTRFLREHLKSLVPAGRLDIDSVGLLVLTQDGRVAKQLVGEDGEIEKEYLVRVATADRRRLPDSSLELLRHGLDLDGEPLKPAVVEWVNDDQLRFVLTQGRKRQIRRMCEAVGLQVLGLKRVRIGKVMLGDLPTGQWRYLRADEGFE